MIDQYGNAVPADLSLLPTYEFLGEEEIELVFAAPWYEVDGILLMPSEDLPDGVEFGDPADADLDVDEDGNIVADKIFKVDDALKRGSTEDGWYHA